MRTEGEAVNAQTVKWTILLGTTALIAYLCLQVLSPFLDVIAWSSILAIAFHPVYQGLVRMTGRPSLSAFLCSILVVVAILIPLLFITGVAINQFVALKEYLQETFKDGLDLGAFGPLRQAYQWIDRHLGLEATQVVAWVKRHAGDLGPATAGYSLKLAASVSGMIVSFIFTIFAMFLLFRDGDGIVSRIPDFLPLERARSETMLVQIRDVIYASVYGVLAIAIIQGGLCAVMFMVLGIPSAALWGIVAVVTSVLPLIGAAAVWIPGTIYLLVIGHWPQAIVLAVCGTLVISTVDNFLRPRLVGERVGQSELVMFFAMLGGLNAFGVLGIVLGPVLFAVAGSILGALSSEGQAAS